MDITHPCFPQPHNNNALVWRYLDLPKFINLLTTRSLYLARIDSLDDVYEGSISQADVIARESLLKMMGIRNNLEQEQILENMSCITKGLRLTAYINCWHLNQEESGAMWRLYNKDNQGVAIQTTYKKLSECTLDKHDNLYIGQVKYIDYSLQATGNSNNLLAPFMHKHKAFHHESEIRIVKWNSDSLPKLETSSGQKLDIEKMRIVNPPGITIPIDLEKIIETIYVNGYADKWYFEAVKSVVENFIPNAKVKWSEFKSEIYY